MTKKDFLKVTTYAAVFGIIGGMTFEGASFAVSKLTGNTVIEGENKEPEEEKKLNTTTTSVLDNDTASTGVSQIVANVLPSIVAIDVTVQSQVQDFFGRSYSQETEGSGSGFIVGQDEKSIYIVTNNHVVSDATKVTVTFQDESVSEATVKGKDSDADLAVVEIPVERLSSDSLSNIKVAALGDSDEVQIGEQAIAIGNALGYGTSVTVGYISAKDREVASEDVNMKLLQTDAAINPGNSGGALVNAEGKVIGINSAKYADEQVEGMGFAIPITVAVPIINDIINSQNVPEDQQAYLGIKGMDVSDEYSQYYNMPKGVYVGEVSEDSPAKEAGMYAGDIIVKFDNREVTTMTGMQERLERCKAGDKVEIVVKRMNNGEYQEVTLQVTLGKKSQSKENTNPREEKPHVLQ